MKKSKRRRKRREWRRHQIKSLTDEIENCLNAELWFAALVLVLILPDICVSLGLAKGKTNGDLYDKWCKKWLANEYAPVSEDLYYLRCGVAHQATSQHQAIKSKRIFFTVGSKDAHMKKHQGALTLDLSTFAEDMIDAVEAWYAKEANDQTVQKNIGAVIQRYPIGSLDFLNVAAIG